MAALGMPGLSACAFCDLMLMEDMRDDSSTSSYPASEPHSKQLTTASFLKLSPLLDCVIPRVSSISAGYFLISFAAFFFFFSLPKF